jgi:hypothetical protein
LTIGDKITKKCRDNDLWRITTFWQTDKMDLGIAGKIYSYGFAEILKLKKWDKMLVAQRTLQTHANVSCLTLSDVSQKFERTRILV